MKRKKTIESPSESENITRTKTVLARMTIEMIYWRRLAEIRLKECESMENFARCLSKIVRLERGRSSSAMPPLWNEEEREFVGRLTGTKVEKVVWQTDESKK